MNMLTHRAEFRRKDVPGDTFRTLEAEDQISMTIRAQAAGLKSWDRDLNRYINSREIAQFNPIEDYLCALPRWDGKDRVSMLADRVPTDTPNWKEFFHTWLLGMVAGWMGRDSEHSNALVPLLTGRQGTGKTSFCRVLLPRELRPYYAENLNLKSETTIALAMSSRALINIDEFDKYTRSQHPLLKFLISQNDVDMRLPFASHMEMRRRFASFIATTNSDRPLVDTTGSRRYLCVRVTDTIDFTTPIDYQQLYAQLLSEVQNGRPFWLNDEQTRLLMAQNEEFLSIAGLPQMLSAVVTPAKADEEGEWLSLTEILERVKKMFPHYVPTANVYHELGRCLKAMSTEVIHTREGNTYKVRAKR
jgi:predicted P-loop ATPase